MKDFINVWTNEANVFLRSDDISRISFAKGGEGFRQSDRIVKVQFKDGSTGEYIGHRDLQKEFGSAEA